jgi:hypothetical protein
MSIFKLRSLTPTTGFPQISTPVLPVQQLKDPPATPIPAHIRTATKEYMRLFLFVLAVVILCGSAMFGQSVPPGSKVYIEPINGFETYLTKAILARKVPVTLVLDEAQADYIVNGSWNKEGPLSYDPDRGPIKTKYTLRASVVDSKTATTAFSYSSEERVSYDPSKEMAADWANHLRNAILKKKNENQK